MALIECKDCKKQISSEAKSCLHCGCPMNSPDTGDLTGVKYLYDSFFGESDKISHRTDWFLIFHAGLFMAFLSAASVGENSMPIQLILNILGVVISYYWLMSGIRAWAILWQFGNYMKHEAIVGRDLYNMQVRIFTERKKINKRFYGWSKPSIVFSMIMPFLFLVSWIIVAVLFYNCQYCLWYILSIIFMLISPIIVSLIDKSTEKKFGV